MRAVSNQWHLDAETYFAVVRAEIPSYDELQDRLAAATAGVPASSILDLGSGTGVTAARVLERHPGSELVGVDSSAPMLELARRTVPSGVFLEQRLEDPLPPGPFDVVTSAFAVHHLSSEMKRDLFARVAAVLRPGGRFVLLDVVVAAAPVAVPVPIEPGVDFPDGVDDQVRWLGEAGMVASLVYADGDLAILRGEQASGDGADGFGNVTEG